MEPRLQIIELATHLCDREVHTPALLASGIYEATFRLADEESQSASAPRNEATLAATARALRKIGEQLLIWATQCEYMPGDWVPMLRKRIGELGDRDAVKLARKLPYLLGSQSPEMTADDTTRPSGEQPAQENSHDPRELLKIPAQSFQVSKPRRVFKRVPPLKCGLCNSAMKPRPGRYGPYMTCTKSPSCTGKLSGVALGVACPEPGCGGHLLEKGIADGSHNIVGCSNYKLKGCDFVTYDPLEHVACHRCGLPFRLVVGSSRECIDPECVPSKLDLVEELLAYAMHIGRSPNRAAAALAMAGGVAAATLDSEPDNAIADFIAGFQEGSSRRTRSPTISPDEGT